MPSIVRLRRASPRAVSQAASRASLLESHDDVLSTFIIGREEPMNVPRIDFMQHFIRDETLHYFSHGNSQALNECIFDLSHRRTERGSWSCPRLLPFCP